MQKNKTRGWNAACFVLGLFHLAPIQELERDEDIHTDGGEANGPFRVAVKVNQGMTRSRRLASTQVESPMTVKSVKPRLMLGRDVLKVINAA